MADESHSMMDGRLHVYRREGSRYWQCSAYLDSRNHRESTREDNLFLAKEYATFWYMNLYVESRKERFAKAFNIEKRAAPNETTVSTPTSGPTFADAAKIFLEEYPILTKGQRSESYVKAHTNRLRRHLLPFLGDIPVRDITSGTMQAYRAHRHKTRTEQNKTPPAPNTLHQETVTARHVMNIAHDRKWIEQVPKLSPAYKLSGKTGHRAWFSPEDYKTLYQATRERAKNPPKEQWRRECEDLHDFVLFMANTGLRPDEVRLIEYRDVKITLDEDTDQLILHIEVRGKRGVGHCKSMPGAVVPFRRMRKRHNPKPTDKVFGGRPRLLNTVLKELNLKFDRDGNPRTAYSLRHTYICMRLMERADVFELAKNCRTSADMIRKHYAVHLKDTINAAAVNVRKPPRQPRPQKNPPSPS